MIAATCQIPIVWENPLENLHYCDKVMEQLFTLNPAPDLVIFPEFFTYGFSVNSEICEDSEGITLRWMLKNSQKYNCAITGSVPVYDCGKKYNRAYFVSSGEDVVFYDKRHVFSYGGENRVFAPGKNLLVISFKGWKIALQICYDLRFPVFIRNTDLKYDLVINVASWPSSRESVIEHLVKSRAIENVCWYAFVNRSGKDPLNCYNPLGFISNHIGESLLPINIIEEFNCSIYSLDITDLEEFRKVFRPWNDADKFKLLK